MRSWPATPWAARRQDFISPNTPSDWPLLPAQAAIAIANARLFEAERARLLLAQTLQALGASLTSEAGLDRVLDHILNLLGRVVHYDSASILLVEEGGQLRLVAGIGFPT